jgi:hypothetical protein
MSRLTSVNLGSCQLIEGERFIASDFLSTRVRYRSHPRFAYEHHKTLAWQYQGPVTFVMANLRRSSLLGAMGTF